ncbi:molybdopterin-dependent oxidoreductase [Dongia sp.]|uniref:molybdopterin-dependent oxidoreductase n=1 Tax=Dongia sp. TaxID=1977262 RepID=UPI0035B2F067
MKLLRALLAGLLLLLAPLVGGRALAIEPLPAPTGEVILVIDGKLGASNRPDGKAAFDLAMLQALPKTSFTTTTIWTDGPQTFEGVRIADLLARLGAAPAEINAVATNDYEIRFPASDATDNDGLIAYVANGAPLPADNKGPLWIVYPYDRTASLQTERFLSQSVWGVDSISLY